ncbi:MAG: ATP-binding cassette domain-containing protein [Dehalococcoidia bacterium]|nr:ATP-binding cassette domain-containing protein [Dehalococcoidia bacterium]
MSFKDVSRWYGDVVAVNEVSFEIAPGITGLLGPNGAGKSTILNMLAGLLKPSRGEVRILGQSVTDNPPIYSHLGFVSERDSIYQFMTCREFVALMARLYSLPDPATAAQRAIATVGLEADQDRPLGGYSKGMRQRARIAAGIVHDPTVLVLDEPFTGTDPRQRLHMMSVLEELAAAGKTIIFSSHILEEVGRVAGSVLVLVGGRLAASGNFREIRRLMTDRPHSVRVTSSDNRALASALVRQSSISGVEIGDGRLVIHTTDLGDYARLLPALARENNVRLIEVIPTDLSLESVFGYLVSKR